MGRTNEEHGGREDHNNKGPGLLNDSGKFIQRSSVAKPQE